MSRHRHFHLPQAPGLRTVRLSRRHERFVYAGWLLLALSGLVWVVAHYFFRQHTDFGDLPSPAEGWCLRAHGAGVMVFLLVLGSLLPNHVHRALQTRRNRVSGIVLLVVCALLTLTGYGLYYVAAENVRPVISLVHWIVGLAAAGFLPLHALLGKRRFGGRGA